MPSPSDDRDAVARVASGHAPTGGDIRVLVVVGSPRRNGNSALLAQAAAEGARSAGAVAVEIAAADFDITPCNGCNACSATGECTIRDRMQEVYGLLDSADGIVVSSPVYFATVPATLKALYDRCQPYWARTYMLRHPRPARRPGALILVRSGGDPFGFSAAIDTTKSVFAVLGVDYVDELLVTGPDDPGAVARMPATVDDARALGVRIAREAARRGGRGDARETDSEE